MRTKATVPMSCKFLAPDLLCPILFSHDAPSLPSPALSFFTTQLLNLVTPWPSKHQPCKLVCLLPLQHRSSSRSCCRRRRRCWWWWSRPIRTSLIDSSCVCSFFWLQNGHFFMYNYAIGGTWHWTAKKIELRKIVWSLGSYEFLPHPITLFIIISKKFAVCTSSSSRDPSLQQLI